MKTALYEIENKQIFYIKGYEEYPIAFLDGHTQKIYKINEKLDTGFYEIFISEERLSFNLIGTYENNDD